MGVEMSQRQKAFELFSQGFGPSSDELKKSVKKHSTRWGYWNQYKKLTGVSAEQMIGAEAEETEGAEATAEAIAESAEHIKEPQLKAPHTVSPKQISIGSIKIPWADWGFTTTFNLLLVAATYEEVCRPSNDGGYGYAGKVGDFCADCVSLFRRLFDFDKMKEEDEHAGRGLLEDSGKGEAVGKQSQEAG